MKPVRMLLHVLTDLAVIAASLGIPALANRQQHGADAVSSASVVAAPSGEFVVLLNPDRLEEDKFWERFFTGQEVDFCFEDITCTVASSDPTALQMAQSLASRLSEHQLTVRQEDQTLLLSKADYGKFQVILLSKEAAEQGCVQTALRGSILAFDIKQEETA